MGGNVDTATFCNLKCLQHTATVHAYRKELSNAFVLGIQRLASGSCCCQHGIDTDAYSSLAALHDRLTEHIPAGNCGKGVVVLGRAASVKTANVSQVTSTSLENSAAEHTLLLVFGMADFLLAGLAVTSAEGTDMFWCLLVAQMAAGAANVIGSAVYTQPQAAEPTTRIAYGLQQLLGKWQRNAAQRMHHKVRPDG